MSKKAKIVISLCSSLAIPILIYALIFLPLEGRNYDVQEYVETTLTGNKLVIVYPGKLYYEKDSTGNSVFSAVLEPSTFPKQSIVDFSNQECTRLVKPKPRIPSASPLASDSETFYISSLEDNIIIKDDKGNIIHDIHLSLDRNHEPKQLHLVSNKPNFFFSKTSCVIISGDSLSNQIILQVKLQAKYQSYLNTILVTLGSILLGIFLSAIGSLIADFIRNLSGDRKELRNSLELCLGGKEWDKAFKISLNHWERFKEDIIEIWDRQKSIQKSELTEEIENIKKFLVAFKTESPLSENVEVLRDIFCYDDLDDSLILQKACKYISQSENAPDDLKRLASTYKNRNLEVIIKALKVLSFDNHDFFQKNLILENKFLNIRCECDYISSIAEFEKVQPEGAVFFQPLYKGDKTKELPKIYSVGSKPLGGKTVLGIWLLKTMLSHAESTKNKKHFPIYVPISGMSAQDQLLDIIELHMSHQLVRYVALNPDEFMNKNLPDIQKRNIEALVDMRLSSFIASLENLGGIPEIKNSRYGDVQVVINHVKTFKNLSWPKRPKDRIEKYGKCLPSNKFAGVLFILDYSMAENAEVDQLLNFCKLSMLHENLRLVVLIPEVFRDRLTELEPKNIQLEYKQNELKKMLNNRLRTDAKQYLNDLIGSINKAVGNVDPTPYELLDSDRFVSASQGLPGKLYQKGYDFLQRVGERQGHVKSADVFGIFYVPDELMGSKANITQSHQESSLLSNDKVIMVANALDQIEASWSTTWISVADAYYIKNGNKIKLVLYENRNLMVRDQRKERIVKSKKKIQEKIFGLDKVTVNLAYPWDPEKGLLFECCPNSLGDQISIVYFDKHLRYLIIVEAFNKSDSDKLLPQIRAFYDGD